MEVTALMRQFNLRHALDEPLHGRPPVMKLQAELAQLLTV
jgi:hypothetical protein